MDENFYTTERLIRYLDGDLPADEVAQLEQQLSQDEALRAELDRLQVAAQAVQYYGLQEQVGRIHQEEVSRRQSGAVKLVRMHSPLRRLLAVAAIFVLLVGAALVIYTARLSGSGVYDEAFVAYSVSTSRSNATVPAIKQAYQEGNYQRVISLGKTRNTGDEEVLLLGLSYLNTNQAINAIEQFSVLSQPNSPYAQDAQFYLALAYLKAKRYDEALALFKSIHENNSHFYHNYVSSKLLMDLKLLTLK